MRYVSIRDAASNLIRVSPNSDQIEIDSALSIAGSIYPALGKSNLKCAPNQMYMFKVYLFKDVLFWDFRSWFGFSDVDLKLKIETYF